MIFFIKESGIFSLIETDISVTDKTTAKGNHPTSLDRTQLQRAALDINVYYKIIMFPIKSKKIIWYINIFLKPEYLHPCH